jgi:hypothetical protein
MAKPSFLASRGGREADGEESTAEPLRTETDRCQTSQSMKPRLRHVNDGGRSGDSAGTCSALVERLSPKPICDDCVAGKLDVSVRQQAIVKTRELAGAGDFERRKDVCSICGGDRIVIRRKGR